jgi:predicted PurR-regulated permease PerM
VVLGLTSLVLSGWLLLWFALDFILLIFAGVLLAVATHGAAAGLQRYVPLTRGWALAAVIVLSLAFLALLTRFTGPRLADQLAELAGRLPDAVTNARDYLSGRPWGRYLVDRFTDAGGMVTRPSDMLGRITGIFSTPLGVLANVLIVAFLGVYLAVDAARYRDALLALVPSRAQPRVSDLLGASGRALGRWMLGRLASMLVVLVLTAAALALLGMPLVLGLSLLAGALTFIPYLGPLLAALPAVLIGWTERPGLALWVAGAYAGVQLLESYVITPLVQDRAVSLPPAALLGAQILMGLAAGILGVFLASPLAVVVIVTVQLLYVRGVLGHDVTPLGASNDG